MSSSESSDRGLTSQLSLCCHQSSRDRHTSRRSPLSCRGRGVSAGTRVFHLGSEARGRLWFADSEQHALGTQGWLEGPDSWGCHIRGEPAASPGQSPQRTGAPGASQSTPKAVGPALLGVLPGTFLLQPLLVSGCLQEREARAGAAGGRAIFGLFSGYFHCSQFPLALLHFKSPLSPNTLM